MLSSKTKKTFFSYIARLGALLFGISICAYVLSDNIHSFDDLFKSHTNISWHYSVVSFIFFVLHTILVFYAWHYSLNMLGVSVIARKTSAIFISSLLTKYLPGGFWHIGSRLLAMTTIGSDPIKVSISLLLEQASAVVICGFISLIFMFTADPAFNYISEIMKTTSIFTVSLIASILIIILLILFPPIFKRLLNKILILFKKQSLHTTISSNKLVVLYLIHALSLLIFVYGYYFVTLMYFNQSPFSFVFLASAVLIATFVGFITPLVPGGIGVREVTLAAILSFSIEGPVLAGIVLLPRIILIIAELLMFLFIIFTYQHNVHENRNY